MIKVNHLTYDYAGKRALQDVSFEITQGSITALVGPNGAGKTTLLRSLAALTKPLSGNVFINNINAFTKPQQVHAQVGYLQDLFGLYDSLTVLQSMQFTAYSRLQNYSNIDEAINLAVQRAGIGSFVHNKINTLSRGMRQRVGIAQAIVHNPKVLLLDEPASGLDPEARHSLSQLLLELRNSGMTIVVSSHILAELEDYSSAMLVIQDGKMIEHRLLNSTSTLTNNYINIEVHVAQDTSSLTSIHLIPGVKEVQITESKLIIQLDETQRSKHALLQQLIAENIAVEYFAVLKTNLQDEYIKTEANYKNAQL